MYAAVVLRVRRGGVCVGAHVDATGLGLDRVPKMGHQEISSVSLLMGADDAGGLKLS